MNDVITDMFAGIPVSDYHAALPWYERLHGMEPTFFPTGTEAVWELAAHRYSYIVQVTEGAGGSTTMVFVPDLDATLAQIAGRGLTPVAIESHGQGVRKAVFRDADGNEFCFGGAPG